MRSTSLFLAVILVAGCAKRAATAAGPSHPELVCGDGAVPTGAVPPEGREAWCHKAMATGEWLREGSYIKFHENTEKAAQGQYKGGKQHGPWTFWYPTGEVESQGSFAGGVKDGFWVSFHSDGSRSGEGKVIDGKEHGPWVYWSEGEQQRTEGVWNLGNREGVWTVYDRDDKPVAERVYRGGRMISKREL